ncbi:hypothetical protein QEN19_000357 [Hanseniaspora menglaensis]
MLRSQLNTVLAKSNNLRNSNAFFHTVSIHLAPPAAPTLKKKQNKLGKKKDDESKRQFNRTKDVSKDSPLASYYNMVSSKELQTNKPELDLDILNKFSQKHEIKLTEDFFESYSEEDIKYLNKINDVIFADSHRLNTYKMFKNFLFLTKDAGKDLSIDHKKNNCLIIDGDLGSGRTTLLKNILLKAYNTKKKLIIPFPDPENIIHERDNLQYMDEIKCYTLINLTREFVKAILKSNHESLLKDIKLNNSYSFSNPEYQIGQPIEKKDVKFKSGSANLLDLLKFNPIGEEVGLLLDIIFKEVHGLKDVKILMVQDRFNDLLFFNKTEYLNTEIKPINITELQITKLLLKTISENASNVDVILSNNLKLTEKKFMTIKLALDCDKSNVNSWFESKNYNENILNSLVNFEAKISPKLVNINNLKINEIKTLIAAIHSHGILNRSGLKEEEIYHLAGNGNTAETFKILSEWLRY